MLCRVHVAIPNTGVTATFCTASSFGAWLIPVAADRSVRQSVGMANQVRTEAFWVQCGQSTVPHIFLLVLYTGKSWLSGTWGEQTHYFQAAKCGADSPLQAFSSQGSNWSTPLSVLRNELIYICNMDITIALALLWTKTERQSVRNYTNSCSLVKCI